MIMNKTLKRTGAAPSNFAQQLAAQDSELAQQVAEDPYNFEFLGLSEQLTQYSVPAHLLGARVFVRIHGTGPGEQVIIVHPGASGPVEVARHDRARPGSPAINDEHFPGTRTRIPGDYEVRARSADEAAFLAIGEGARTWLVEAAAAGTARMNVKMAEAVTLAKIAGTDQVDRALGDAALHGRFAPPDLPSILNANIRRATTHAANEATSLTQGTGAWAAIGNPTLNTRANTTSEEAR
jgi:hypothetical protein